VDNYRDGRERHEGALAKGTPMHMASDYIHPTPRGGRCRIRVYLPDEEHEVDQ
jgi:hypothetical protein